MVEVLPIVSGIVIPTLTSWLSDQLPRPGLGIAENERRIRNIVLASIVGFGVYYIAEKIWGKASVEGKTVSLVKVD